MDAAKLLLSSAVHVNVNSSSSSKAKDEEDDDSEANRLGPSLLDTLAELAALQSPAKQGRRKGAELEDALPLMRMNSSEEMASYLEGMRRPRANSEPWIKRSSDNLSLGPYFEAEGEVEYGYEEEEADDANLSTMMESYQHIYNRGGRIGIYTRNERDDIIRRFHEKRKRRVWKKKIRCAIPSFSLNLSLLICFSSPPRVH